MNNEKRLVRVTTKEEMELGTKRLWYGGETTRDDGLLFSLNINDITSDIESEIRFFADDCVCYREKIH